MSASIAELAARLRSGADTCTALTQRALDAAVADEHGAFVDVHSEQALRAAERADRELTEGIDRGPLHGIPVAVKDNIDVASSWTRCGTAALGHRWADHDAAVVGRLRGANAVVLGKTRTHELAWGMVTSGCRNPRDVERITGGSSGGSAAAVAAGIVPVALGTDTGGSVRNPAALCGVAGLKAAVGSLPMDGIAPMAPTQDSVGVLAGSIADCRAVVECLHGSPSEDRAPARVALLTDSWAHRTEPEVTRAVTDAVERFRAHGVEVVERGVRHSELAASASYVIMLAEAARNWWPGDGKLPAGVIGAEVREQLRLGSRVSERDYARAREVREALVRETEAALNEVDALMLASCPVLPSPIGAEAVECAGRTVPVGTAHSALTALGAVAGMSALSIPGLSTDSGLPTGIQLVGTDVGLLCRCAEVLENRTIARDAMRNR